MGKVWIADGGGRPTPPHRPLSAYGPHYRRLAQDAMWTPLRAGEWRVAWEALRVAWPLLPRWRDRVFAVLPPPLTWRVGKVRQRFLPASMRWGSPAAVRGDVPMSVAGAWREASRRWWAPGPQQRLELRPGWYHSPEDPPGVDRWWDGYRYTDETDDITGR